MLDSLSGVARRAKTDSMLDVLAPKIFLCAPLYYNPSFSCFLWLIIILNIYNCITTNNLQTNLTPADFSWEWGHRKNVNGKGIRLRSYGVTRKGKLWNSSAGVYVFMRTRTFSLPICLKSSTVVCVLYKRRTAVRFYAILGFESSSLRSLRLCEITLLVACLFVYSRRHGG